jgi:hypothetical protein
MSPKHQTHSFHFGNFPAAVAESDNEPRAKLPEAQPERKTARIKWRGESLAVESHDLD